MAFMNGLAVAKCGLEPQFFSVQYREVGFIHWGERTTIYKNNSRDEKRQVGNSRNYERRVQTRHGKFGFLFTAISDDHGMGVNMRLDPVELGV